MKKTFVSLFFCVGIFTFSCTEETPQPQDLKKAIHNIVYPHIALGSNVGIILGTIKNGQKEVYAFGEKELGKPEQINAENTLEIASLTKPFTALALADMVAKGEVKLDDPVEDYLPDGTKIPSKNGVKITFRHLANHTSGLPRLANNMDEDAYNPYKDYSEQDFFDFLSSYNLSQEPGTKYEYSNVGYGLLGYILSKINKSNYEILITGRILSPLQMNNTFVRITEAKKTNHVSGYNGNKKAESWSQYQEEIMQGTGSLSSSMSDLLKFLEVNINPASSSLKQALELTRQLNFKVNKHKQDGIGLGWSFYTLNDAEILWKNGLNGAYSSFIGFDKERKTGVVVMCNSSLNPDLIQTEIGFEILKLLN